MADLLPDVVPTTEKQRASLPSVASINSITGLAELSIDGVKKLRGIELAQWLVHGPIGISRASALLLNDSRITGKMLFTAAARHGLRDFLVYERKLTDKTDVLAVATHFDEGSRHVYSSLFLPFALILA